MSKKTIMLVDDDPLCILISTKIIELNPDLRVTSFTNPGVALSQLKEWYATGSANFPDFIFLDINMPVMNGWEFLEELKRLPEDFQQKCNIIMLSSSINPVDQIRSRTFETVSEFVSKPLTVDKVQTLIVDKEPKW